MGVFVRSAISAVPPCSSPSAPVALRVPSGNMPSIPPARTVASASRMASRSEPPRRTGKAPHERTKGASGHANSSALAMKRTWRRRTAMASAMGSTLPRWLEARMSGPSITCSRPSTVQRPMTHRMPADRRTVPW